MAALYNNYLAQQIYSILITCIGDSVAQGSIKIQCNKLGITEDTIRLEHLSQIAEGIRKGLVLFIGTEQAKIVADRINRCH